MDSAQARESPLVALLGGSIHAGNARTAALATLCLLNLTIGHRDRVPEWKNALDCVVPLVKLTRKGRIWKAESLIRSWYELRPAVPAAALVPPEKGNGHALVLDTAGE